MMIRSSALALGLAGALALAAPLAAPSAALADDAPTRTMTLSGTGIVFTTPDKAIVSIGVYTEAQTAADALSANSESMQAVIDMLKEKGLDARDIQTAQFSVDPRFVHDDNNRNNPPRLVGYTVSNEVRATVRELTSIGTILDRAVRVGSNRINGIRFAVSEPGPLEDEARRQAVKTVIDRAELYAEAAGIELGPILSIAEGGSYAQEPRYARFESMAADSSVPIEAGQQAISMQVNITWELR